MPVSQTADCGLRHNDKNGGSGFNRDVLKKDPVGWGVNPNNHFGPENVGVGTPTYKNPLFS